ncbi:mechanosensitive ion channel family protein [Fibrella forsythiae]|uniref:Mechanosensitive ion channel family protein n=1 Tax=Fibrella forsythiae TaxID=2817061 RepID=A0ABS3JR12_9BACT|nr:mechanosensitive ion channel family protein [Fibrella forsythiae]MBO0952437.1 mechanosensitive ion channel family protein [Fibrella forsythiae]
MDFSKIISLLYTELAGWARYGVRLIPRLALALIILIAAVIIARWVSRWVRAGLNRVSRNESLATLTGSVVRVIVVAVGLFMALGVLGLEKTVTSLLAGAGVIALAVGFAFQDLTANFISGTMIALARPIQVGDTIETNGFTGKVLYVRIRSILLDNGQGQTVEIPSKDVFQKPIINHSRNGLRRIEVAAGVSYLDDLAKAKRIAQDAVKALPFIVKGQSVELHYRAFGDNNIQFMLWFWIDPLTTNAAAAQSEAIMAIRNAYTRNQILMVFAGHTFDLKQKLFGNAEEKE